MCILFVHHCFDDTMQMMILHFCIFCAFPELNMWVIRIFQQQYDVFCSPQGLVICCICLKMMHWSGVCVCVRVRVCVFDCHLYKACGFILLCMCLRCLCLYVLGCVCVYVCNVRGGYLFVCVCACVSKAPSYLHNNPSPYLRL